MDKKVYLAMFKDSHENLICLGSCLDNSEKAFDIIKNFLHSNPTIPIENVWVEEYFYKKDLKIIDIQD